METSSTACEKAQLGSSMEQTPFTPKGFLTSLSWIIWIYESEWILGSLSTPKNIPPTHIGFFHKWAWIWPWVYFLHSSDFVDISNPFLISSWSAQLQFFELAPHISLNSLGPQWFRLHDIMNFKFLTCKPSNFWFPNSPIHFHVILSRSTVEIRSQLWTSWLQFHQVFKLFELRSVETLLNYPLCSFPRSDGLE